MTKKIKIGFIHPALMDYRLELFEMLNSEYDVNFIFTKQGRGQANVKEKHLNPRGWKYKILRTDYLVKNRDIGMYLKLIKELLFEKYNVLLVSNSWYICWPIARLTHKKFIYWTEFWHWENTSTIRKILNSITFYIARHSDAVIATGTKSAQAQMSIGVNKDKIFTHPQCSVDYSQIHGTDFRKKLNLDNKKIVLYIGRLVEEKGVPYLIEAMSFINKQFDNAFLIIVGTGPLENYYKELAKKLGVTNILFQGYVENESEKNSYYNACNIFVLPSIFINNIYDPWGLVVNEAMAFGKPIVTTDAVGAGYDMIKEGTNGYVVKNGNSLELSTAILRIITDEELEKEMGLKSKKIFHEKNNNKKLFAVFKSCVDTVCR